MRAAVLVATDAVEVRDVEAPASAGKALVAPEVAGICGTDLGIVAGRFPVSPPRVLGHEVVARVVAPGPLGLLTAGQRVLVNPSIACGQCTTCRRGLAHLCPNGGLMGREEDGGFAELLAVEEHRLLDVPEHITRESASLLQVLGTCVHAQRDEPVFPGQTAVVIGLGVTGLLILQVLHARGIATVGVTRSAWKRELAGELGATATAAPDEAAAAVADLTRGEGADLVVEAVGSVPTLVQAIELAAFRATVVAFGSIGGTPTATLPFYRLYARELRLHYPRAATADDYARAISLVADGTLAVERLHTHAFALEDVRDALATSATPDALKVTVAP